MVIKLYALIAALASCALASTQDTSNASQDVDPKALLNRSIDAILGTHNASQIRSIALHGPRILHVRSVPLSLSLDGAMDTSVLVKAGQNLSYSYEQPFVRQRMDRLLILGSLWYYAQPTPEPLEFSLVVHGGKEGFAAVVAGDMDPAHISDTPIAYLEGLQAGFHQLDAVRWDPLLVKTILENDNFTYAPIEHEGIDLLEVHDNTLDVSVLLDAKSYLPYIVRTTENHPLLGKSTYDVRTYDYRSVNGVMVPHHYKSIYNSDKLVVDWQVDDVEINPELPATWFDGPNSTFEERNIPYTNDTMMAEIQEKSNNYIYFGLPYNGTVEAFKAYSDWPDLPKVWALKLPEWYRYRQLIMEFDDFVVVVDCPPQQSHTIIAWVKANIGKPIKYIVPTHHHHDHTLGLSDYIKAGAKAVVPDFAKQYYITLGDDDFETFTATDPYIIQSSTMKAVFINMQKSVHAKDLVYAVVMPACITENSTMLVFDADHMTRDDMFDDFNDQAEFWEMIQDFKTNRISRSTKIVESHSFKDTLSLELFLESTGANYPNFTLEDFLYAPPKCV